MKKYVGYFGVLVAFFITVILFDWANQSLKKLVTRTYSYIEYSILISTIGFIIFGMFLGSMQFAREFKKNGKWKVNKEKLIVLGLPLFIVVTMTILMFTGVFWPSFIRKILIDIMNSKMMFSSITIFLGYIIATSFTRISENVQDIAEPIEK